LLDQLLQPERLTSILTALKARHPAQLPTFSTKSVKNRHDGRRGAVSAFHGSEIRQLRAACT
jgi:hypothetical protein